MIPRMSTGNWIFWAIMAFLGLNLFWLGVIEKYVTQWVGFIIALLIAFAIIKYGPRELDAVEEEEE